MLKKSLLDALFGKTKKALLTQLYAHPEQGWHLRELARVAGVSSTMLSKEANLLAAAGLILEERDGNRRRIRANPDSPIFEELRGIARKTAGLAEIVGDALQGVAGIDYAFIFGSVARGEEHAGSDVDVCVVGSARSLAVNQAMSAVEAAVGRPVNPLVYTLAELRERRESANYFVLTMLGSKKIFLIGDDDEFDRALAKPGTEKQSPDP